MRECLDDLRIVVVILIRGRIEGSLDLKLPVSLGLKRSTYLKLLNVSILKIMVGSPLAWPIILIVGILVGPFTYAGSDESSDPIGKDSKLFGG